MRDFVASRRNLLPVWVASACLLAAFPTAPAQPTPAASQSQQNVVPNPDIPTATYDPAVEADPRRLRTRKLRLLLQQKKYQEFQTLYAAEPSADWATALAWAYYNDHRLPEAKTWFKKALVLDPNEADATHGLTVLDQRAHQPLLAVGPGSAQIRQANQSFQQKHYQRALDELDEAKALAPLGRGARMLQAWSTFQLGRNDVSARLFEDLYRESRIRKVPKVFYLVSKNWISGIT
jgi:tetratricopeptide (TPR) repeat protein